MEAGRGSLLADFFDHDYLFRRLFLFFRLILRDSANCRGGSFDVVHWDLLGIFIQVIQVISLFVLISFFDRLGRVDFVISLRNIVTLLCTAHYHILRNIAWNFIMIN